MESVEYRSVIRLLFLKGFTLKEALDEMKVVYGENARFQTLASSVQMRSYVSLNCPNSWAPTV